MLTTNNTNYKDQLLNIFKIIAKWPKYMVTEDNKIFTSIVYKENEKISCY